MFEVVRRSDNMTQNVIYWKLSNNTLLNREWTDKLLGWQRKRPDEPRCIRQRSRITHTKSSCCAIITDGQLAVGRNDGKSFVFELDRRII